MFPASSTTMEKASTLPRARPYSDLITDPQQRRQQPQTTPHRGNITSKKALTQNYRPLSHKRAWSSSTTTSSVMRTQIQTKGVGGLQQVFFSYNLSRKLAQAKHNWVSARGPRRAQQQHIQRARSRPTLVLSLTISAITVVVFGENGARQSNAEAGRTWCSPRALHLQQEWQGTT